MAPLKKFFRPIETCKNTIPNIPGRILIFHRFAVFNYNNIRATGGERGVVDVDQPPVKMSQSAAVHSSSNGRLAVSEGPSSFYAEIRCIPQTQSG